MEDVLETYSRDPADDGVPARPDETSRQQTGETRTPLPARPGQVAGHGFGYARSGTASLFMMTAPLGGWRHVRVTDRRTRQDLAEVLEDLADSHFPGRRIVPVMDSPDTHTPPTLHDLHPPEEAARLARRSDIHHTPNTDPG